VYNTISNVTRSCQTFQCQDITEKQRYANSNFTANAQDIFVALYGAYFTANAAYQKINHK